MLHLKPLFHFTTQKRDTTPGEIRCYISQAVLQGVSLQGGASFKVEKARFAA